MKVLVAVQDKESGRLMVDYIAANLWPPNTVFQIFHVVDTTHLLPFADRALHDVADDMLNRLRIAGLKLVDFVRDQLVLLVPDATILREVVDGCPKERILAEAESWPANLIVMGTHRWSEAQRFFLGSVSKDVIKNAGCSVLIIKPSKTDAVNRDPSAETTTVLT